MTPGAPIRGRIIQILEIPEADGVTSIGVGVANKQNGVSYGRLCLEHADGDRSRLIFEPDDSIRPFDTSSGVTARAHTETDDGK